MAAPTSATIRQSARASPGVVDQHALAVIRRSGVGWGTVPSFSPTPWRSGSFTCA
jgi:hypothetical protein